MLFWRNANSDRDDAYLMVDLSHDESGSVQKIVNKSGVWGRRLTGRALDDAVASGEMLFTPHRQTCTAHKPANPKPQGLEIEWPATKNRRSTRGQ